MGTPDFAVPSLKKIAETHTVVGVVTQPDKPKGRHMTLTPPPVKVTAEALSIPVFQPTTLKDGAFSETLNTLSPDIIIVVAYGKILPKYILDFPRFGCINLHGSILPEYRGAAPMQRAIMQGKDVIGVTTMYMAEGLDTGDMLEVASLPLTDDDDFETVHDKLATRGADLLISTIQKLENGSITPIPQDDTQATYAAKIENADCVLSFDSDSRTIFNQIRGLSPFPLAFCKHNGKMLKIIKARPIDEETLTAQGFDLSSPVGSVLALNNGSILIRCQTGALAVTAILPEGKSRMKAQDFINGRKIAVGDILT